MSERKILKVIKKQKVIGPKDTMWYNLMSYYSYPNPAPHCTHDTDRFYGVYPSAKEKMVLSSHYLSDLCNISKLMEMDDMTITQVFQNFYYLS